MTTNYSTIIVHTYCKFCNVNFNIDMGLCSMFCRIHIQKVIDIANRIRKSVILAHGQFIDTFQVINNEKFKDYHKSAFGKNNNLFI